MKPINRKRKRAIFNQTTKRYMKAIKEAETKGDRILGMQLRIDYVSVVLTGNPINR